MSKSLLKPQAILNIAVLAVALLVPQIAQAQSAWPQYGYDAGHTFFNPAETALTTSNVPSLRLAWVKQLGQPDVTSPIQVKGMMVLCSDTTGLTVVKPENGQIVASRASYPGVDCGSISDYSSYGSPASNGTLLYVASTSAGKEYMTAFGLTGGIQWVKYVTDPEWTFLSFTGPTISRNKAFLTDNRYDPVGHGVSSVYALDATTGKKLWSKDIDVGSASAPVAGGNHVFVRVHTYLGIYQERLIAYDAGTGAEAWRVAQPGYSFTSTMFANDKVISGLRSGPLFYVGALDPATGTSLWQKDLGHSFLVPSAGYGNLLYLNSTTELAALDSDDGSDVWTDSIPNGATIYSNLAIANNVIFFAVLDRTGSELRLQAVNATSGQILDTTALEPLSISPDDTSKFCGVTVAGGRVHVVTGQGYVHVYALPQ